MIIYDLFKLYKSLKFQQAQLKKQLKETTFHSLRRRKINGKEYYFERKFSGGKDKLVAITKDEYRQFLIEAYRHQRAEDELREVEALIKKGAKKALEYQRKLKKYEKQLEKISKIEPPGKPSTYMPEHLKYKTLRGETVRSKSEAMICDALYRRGIWYKYEMSIENWPYLPDFYIVDSIQGRPIIWEHFGLLDDPEYLQKAFEKILFYQKHGFTLGDNLIVTMEPFDAEKAGKIIDTYFVNQSLAA